MRDFLRSYVIPEGAGCKEYLIASVLDGLEEVPSLDARKNEREGRNCDTRL